MQVFEVLVTQSPGSIDLGNGWSGPVNGNRPARVLTYKVTDRKLVGDKIIEEFGNIGGGAYWQADGLLRIDFPAATWRRWRRYHIRRIQQIIEAYKGSTQPTNEPSALYTM